MNRILIISSFLYGALCAVAINCRLANWLWVLVGVLILQFIFITPSMFKFDGDSDNNSVLQKSFNILRAIILPLFIFIGITGIGTGLFVLRIYNTVKLVESRRPEIEATLASKQCDLSGMSFSGMKHFGNMEISPCWTDDVIVYHKGTEYIIVLPLTRPLPMSFSSFDVMMWTKELGWRKDKIHWSIQALD